MLLLDATTKSVEAVLEAAPAANQPSFMLGGVDYSSGALTPYSNDGALSGVTPVTLAAAPGSGVRRQMQHVAAAQRPTAVAAKLAEGKGTFTAQIVRYLNAATQAEIASDPWPAYRPQPEGRTRRNSEYAVHLLVDAVERYGQRRAADHRLYGGIKFQGGSAKGDLQRSFALGIAQQTVAQAQRPVIHRSRGRYTHRPVPQTSRVVLDAGLGAGAQNLHGIGPVAQLLQTAGPGFSGSKRRKAEDLLQVLAVGFDAVQAGLRQSLRQAGDRLIAAGAPDDSFRQQRVEKRRHLTPGLHPAIDAQGGAVRRRKPDVG